MTASESTEHIRLKMIMQQKLTEWFSGIALKEYKTAGHEADIYGVTENGVLIHIEITWTPDRFYPNLTFLLISDADIRCMICSDKTLEKHLEEYKKATLEQLKRGIFLTRAFRAEPVLALDSDYLEQIRLCFLEFWKRVPSEARADLRRSYWYINDVLANQVVMELKPEWKMFPLTSQLRLVEEELTFLPTEIRHDEGFCAEMHEVKQLDDLIWKESKRLIKGYGRFFAPFGVKEECVSQFVWNPCYSEFLETQISNVHIVPEFIRSEASITSLLGTENWQRPDIFIVGKVEKPQSWQPHFLEPFVIYTSAEESRQFHKMLMERVAEVHDLSENAVDFLAKNFGANKATAVNSLVRDTIVVMLREQCWERPIDFVMETADALSKIPLVVELSMQTREEILGRALSWIINSRMALSSIEEIKDDLHRGMSMLNILKRHETVVRSAFEILKLPADLDGEKLVSYYGLIQDILYNLSKVVVIKRRKVSHEAYQVSLSIRIGAEEEFARLRLWKPQLDHLLLLVKESRT